MFCLFILIQFYITAGDEQENLKSEIKKKNLEKLNNETNIGIKRLKSKPEVQRVDEKDRKRCKRKDNDAQTSEQCLMFNESIEAKPKNQVTETCVSQSDIFQLQGGMAKKKKKRRKKKVQ